MVSKKELCSDAARLLCDGVPLKLLSDGTRYFLYPLNKADYDIVFKAITELRESISKMSYDNSQIVINEFIHKWGYNPFKEGAFMGTTKIKTDEDYKCIQSLFETVKGKIKPKDITAGSYQCFCHKNFKTLSYMPHRTIKESWECMLIAYNNPTHAIILTHKVDEDGNRLWGE